MKKLIILLAAIIVIALPFIFERPQEAGDWEEGDPELIIITPHNEAIRHEFARGFSAWHQKKYGKPVRIDWRVIGGTTEIMRYLTGEYAVSAEHYVKRQARLGKKLTEKEAMALDDPEAVSSQMDLFFGGGTYDHGKAESQGLTVPAWNGNLPKGLFTDSEGRVLLPKAKSGEIWNSRCFYGTVLSTFGVCYNLDRLKDLGIDEPPKYWEDLTGPRYFGYVGVADPTKSGSVAKAFEMMIHSVCARQVEKAGFSRKDILTFEEKISRTHSLEGIPPRYQNAIERGWLEGLNVVRKIGANARYFTDAAGKIPVDICSGVTAAGIAIDFYGRQQSELSKRYPDGSHVMGYTTPVGGSSVSADPISLLRGAPHRELAVRFIEYVLGEEGQKLWNYRVGEPGGADRYALRRLPLRRTFYPSSEPDIQRIAEKHFPHYSDPLDDPSCDAYRLADSFLYVPRWTSKHFGVQRDLIRSMCLDSGEELRSAWHEILKHGGPEKQPGAMRLLEAFPTDPALEWGTVRMVYGKMPRLDRLRIWAKFFRNQYRAARKAVKE